MPEFIKSLLKDKSFKILDKVIYYLVQEKIVLDAKLDLFILTINYTSKLPSRNKALDFLKQQLSTRQKEILNKYLK